MESDIVALYDICVHLLVLSPEYSVHVSMEACFTMLLKVPIKFHQSLSEQIVDTVRGLMSMRMLEWLEGSEKQPYRYQTMWRANRAIYLFEWEIRCAGEKGTKQYGYVLMFCLNLRAGGG